MTIYEKGDKTMKDSKGRKSSEATSKPRHKTAGKFIKRRADFTVKAPVGSEVFLAGSFNDWNPESMPMVDKDGTGVFTRRCFLMAGRYEYKFVINGVWQIDDNNPDFVSNDMVSLNSVLELGD